MFQTLAVSPLVFIQLSSEDKRTQLDFFSALETETILYDKNNCILEEYDCVKDKINNSILKQLLEEFIKGIPMGKGKKIENVDVIKRNEKKLSNLETEMILVKNNTDWNIILTDLPTKLKFSITKPEIDYEFASPSNYLKPDDSSQILSDNDKIEKKKGTNYDLVSWLSKFIKSAKQIEIHDGYLQSERALRNLEKIITEISNTNKKMPVEITTMSDVARNTHHIKSTNAFVNLDDNKNIDEEIKKLGNKYELVNLFINFKKDKRDISDRKIITDKFQVVLGHSLDAVDNDNYVVKQFDIQVSLI